VNGQRPRLLALRALGLGDFLCGLPALRALTAAFPWHERLLAAPAVLGPLVELSGCGFSLVHAGPLQQLPRTLDGPQVAVNLHGRGPQSHRLLLQTSPGCLIGFSHPAVPESAGSPQWRREEHETLRWCRLLSETGIAADPERLEIDASCLDPASGRLQADIVLHPGASSRSREWPPERWAAVARALALAGRQVVLTGGAAERRLAAGIAREAGVGSDVVLAGRTTLLQLTAAVSAATLVVCGDTGIAHLATALGTPSVVLFGPTSPARWGPPGGRCHRVLWKGTTGDPHAGQPDTGLLRIEVGEVLKAIDQTLDEAGSEVLR
jgi:ADP-heptose:LPS heptosyltransferase